MEEHHVHHHHHYHHHYEASHPSTPAVIARSRRHQPTPHSRIPVPRLYRRHALRDARQRLRRGRQATGSNEVPDPNSQRQQQDQVDSQQHSEESLPSSNTAQQDEVQDPAAEAPPSDIPAQQEIQERPVEEILRGFAIFCDSLSTINLNQLRTSTLRRVKNHEKGEPPGKEAKTNNHQHQRKIYSGRDTKPTPGQRNYSLTVVERAYMTKIDGEVRVVNSDDSGPQMGICWRVPGPRNIWLARTNSHRMNQDLRALVSSQSPPHLTCRSCVLWQRGEARSTIMSSSPKDPYERIERGEEELMLANFEDVFYPLGTILGFETVKEA